MRQQARIIFTVTNDLNYDQRMIRICSTLQDAGYEVLLVGFKRKKSLPLVARSYKQVRLPVIAEQGKIMYIDYWIKLFFFLFFKKMDILCAIDLDTILPVYIISIIRNKKRVYDAHEIFTELKEVISRPFVYRLWSSIAKITIPNFKYGYSVSESCVEEIDTKYGVDYKVVRSATVLKQLQIPEKPEKYILYQGWVNIGRCFEQLIPAMQQVDATLIVCGEGNFYKEAVALVKQHALESKVIFKGYVPPEELAGYTLGAWIGITLFEGTSQSNRFSLANRFFDYMHAGVPQLCVSYSEYQKINAQYEVAHLIDKPTEHNIVAGLNRLLADDAYYKKLQANCLVARQKYNWQNESKTLLTMYEEVSAN